MFNDIQISADADFAASIRATKIDGKQWFVAQDALTTLGIKASPSVAFRPLDACEKRVITKSEGLALSLRHLFVGKAPRMTLISESGLYKLVMRSDKPQAKAFQNWVTKTVLPAIRKDGVYIVGEEKLRTWEMSEDESLTRSHTMNWVTKSVLPSIRKHGGYVMGEEKLATGEMSGEEFMARTVLLAQKKLKRLTAERNFYTAEVEAVTLH